VFEACLKKPVAEAHAIWPTVKVRLLSDWVKVSLKCFNWPRITELAEPEQIFSVPGD
jgi:hypothetical protein